MQAAHFDFEALQPSILRMIRSARSHLHRHSTSEEGESSQAKGSADSSISAVRAASRRRSDADYDGKVDRMVGRSHRLTSRSRSTLYEEANCENKGPEKQHAPTPPAGVLGDATNTYNCTGRPASAKIASPAKVHVLEQRIPRRIPLPPTEPDIGELDGFEVKSDNPQHAAEYVQDIFQALKLQEELQLVGPTYMDRQVHVNAKMRGILVDWLVDVHKKYKLRAETLFLAVQLIDRYLEIKVVPRAQLQLVGATALLIAAKFEEIYPPAIKEFEYITDKAYSRDEILKMEVCILKALSFNVCCPTAMHFFEHYHSVNGCTNAHRHLAQYLLELSLVEYNMLKYGPSHMAAASILLSNKLLQTPSWTPTLVKQTQMTEAMLRECAREMCVLLESTETSSKQAVRKKFSQATYSSVAKLSFMSGQRTPRGQSAATSSRRSSGGVPNGA